MAKDKDQEVFVEPEFNQRDFLNSEKQRAKATIVVFLLAAALGLVSGYFYIIGIWYVAVIIVLLLLIYFKRLLRALHLKVPEVSSHMFFLVMVFFLTWIIFWTVSLNPPIHTTAQPEIKDLEYHFGNVTNWTGVSGSNNVYTINIPQNNYNTAFRMNVSYVKSLETANITLYQVSGGSHSTMTSHYFNGWLYFNQTLSTSGSGSVYDYSVNIIFNGVSSQPTFTLNVHQVA